MNPPSSDVEVPEGTSGTAESRALTLHLEVCRMQTELEVLERRIAQYERAESTGVGPHDPFAERAEDLVQRMVDALYAIGRSEIVESTEASRATAEETIAAGRRRAQEILVAARAELAEALTARAEAHDAAQTTDLVDLTEGNDEAEPVVVLADVIATPTVAVPVDRPWLDATETQEADAVAATPDAGVEAVGAVETDVETAHVETAHVETADSGVDVIEVDRTADADQDLAVETTVAEALEADTETADGADEIVDVTEVDGTAQVDEAVAVEAPVEATASLLLPPPGAADEVPVVDQPWLPPTPAPDLPPSHSYPPPAPKGAQGATERTDEAFDAWLAVAPPPRTPSDDVAPASELPYDDSTPSRRRWVRPLEAAAALLVVLVLLVLALVVLI